MIYSSLYLQIVEWYIWQLLVLLCGTCTHMHFISIGWCSIDTFLYLKTANIEKWLSTSVNLSQCLLNLLNKNFKAKFLQVSKLVNQRYRSISGMVFKKLFFVILIGFPYNKTGKMLTAIKTALYNIYYWINCFPRSWAFLIRSICFILLCILIACISRLLPPNFKPFCLEKKYRLIHWDLFGDDWKKMHYYVHFNLNYHNHMTYIYAIYTIYCSKVQFGNFFFAWL